MEPLAAIPESKAALQLFPVILDMVLLDHHPVPVSLMAHGVYLYQPVNVRQ